MKYSHQDLVEIGYKWVMRRCSFAFMEMKTIGIEIPDVIGFNTHGTFVLEAKVSRADFIADHEKSFRSVPRLATGDWRFYIAPTGLIDRFDLPLNWGLIEVDEKGRARLKDNPYGKGNMYGKWTRCAKNERAEKYILLSALRRVPEKKLQEYVKPKKQ